VQLRAGDTFFMADTGGALNPSGSHLMVCIVALTDKGNVIVVPIVTKHSYSDGACVIQAGEHPRVTHESCASYDWVKTLSAKAMSKALVEGSIKLEDPVPAEVLLRLQVGLAKSDETPGWALAEANATGLTAHLKANGQI
jgi:hypothetical protein